MHVLSRILARAHVDMESAMLEELDGEDSALKGLNRLFREVASLL